MICQKLVLIYYERLQNVNFHFHGLGRLKLAGYWKQFRGRGILLVCTWALWLQFPVMTGGSWCSFLGRNEVEWGRVHLLIKAGCGLDESCLKDIELKDLMRVTIVLIVDGDSGYLA